MLTLQLREHEVAADLEADRGVAAVGLGPTHCQGADSSGRGDEEDGSVRVQVDERDADAVQPPDRVERDGPGVADDDHALEIGVHPAKPIMSALTADAVLENEMAALDRDPKSVPAQHENAVLTCRDRPL